VADRLSQGPRTPRPAAAAAPARVAAISLAALPLAILLLPATAVEAKPITFRVVKEFDGTQRTASPSFAGMQDPMPVDRGRLLYLGHGIWGEHGTFHFLELKTPEHRERTVDAPLAAFFEKSAEVFPNAKGTGFPTYRVGGLLYYDEARGEAALTLSEEKVLFWDLGKNAISGFESFPRGPSTVWQSIMAVGYDPATGEGYVLLHEGLTSEPPPAEPPPGDRRALRGPGILRQRTVDHSRATVFALRDGKARRIASATTKGSLSRGPFFDEKGWRVLVPEYDELPLKGDEPRGHLFDLKSGAVSTIEIPVTAYGFAFSPDGRRVHVFSSQLGEVWTVDAKTGKRTARAKVGKLGFTLGFYREDTLLLLKNAGLLFLDPSTLTRRTFIESRKLFPGFSHFEGSAILPEGRVALKNWNKLYIVELGR
jgi:hypothetical protein